VERLCIGAPLAEAPKEAWYGGDAHSYTDYFTLKQERVKAAK
jgi:N-ethylmaleimide reductase